MIPSVCIGAPDSVNILVNTVYSTDTLTISVGVIDDSQSPANALTVGISDVLEHDIDLVAQGYTLPVRNEEMIALTIPLDTLYTSNYNLYVTAKNPLGSTNVYNKQLYIEGMMYTVDSCCNIIIHVCHKDYMYMQLYKHLYCMNMKHYVHVCIHACTCRYTST